MNNHDQRRAEYAAFIVGRLRENGRVNRRDMHDRYKLTPAAIATIFRQFRERNVGAMVYDETEKAYLPGPRFAERFPEQPVPVGA